MTSKAFTDEMEPNPFLYSLQYAPPPQKPAPIPEPPPDSDEEREDPEMTVSDFSYGSGHSSPSSACVSRPAAAMSSGTRATARRYDVC